ncbi:armadillo repeat-containing protein 10 isoform X2 [Hippocampus comes]|uniref:armadillo repeat-containing protein 10 isoform X2 n=1 Tax=Hippocampus comes TaxID=109280 RepID=UPI00094ED0E6|nr:PREDICTED: armadillo repeat-containing protein 10 isoform X2 [Hippocampus comes]
MGDSGSITPRIGSMKTLLGIVAGAGVSYGIYKLLSGGSFRRYKKSGGNEGLASKTSEGNIIHQSVSNLEPQHLNMLLTCLKASNSTSERCRLLLTLGNAAAFTVNQNIIREYEGIPIIGGFLSDPAPEVKVQTLNALSNLCMNLQNQEQLKVYVPQVLQLIEMSPMNSDLQLAALRMLTNLSVTDKHQHLLKDAVTLLLHLLLVSDVTLQVQTLKVLVNMSSNPDMMDDIVQAQAPASVMLLFAAQTSSEVLMRLLTFTGNLKSWRPSAQVAEELRRNRDCLFRVMLDESSELHGRLVQLLSHPDKEIQAQVAHILT